MKMKSLKTQFIGAIAMVLVAAIAMGSSTYAWFAMNGTVKAEGMKVQAKAEDGIMIKASATNIDGFTIPDAAKTYKSTVSLAMADNTVQVLPVSTVDASTWKSNTSGIRDDANAGAASETYDAVTATSGYYAKYDYKIRTSGANAMTNQQLKIKTVTATAPGTPSTAALDMAVRVAVVYGTQCYIYAPLETDGADFFNGNNSKSFAPTYAASAVNVYKAPDSTHLFTLGSAATNDADKIPASEEGLDVSIYVYFEGEDANCKSTNLNTTLDNIGVSVEFEAVDKPAAGG